MKLFQKFLMLLVGLFCVGALLELGTIFLFNANLHQLFFPKLYKTSFCEVPFVCTEEHKEYHQKVAQGYERMKNKRVVFAGLARDIQRSLPMAIERIEATGNAFKDYRVLVFENDSSDETRNLLRSWEQNNEKMLLIECPEIKDCKLGKKKMYDYGPRSYARISKMASFRNRYLSIIQTQFSDFDYAIVVDLDLNGPWSRDGIAHTIAHDQWDGVFAYGLHSLIGTFGMVLAVYDALAYVGINAAYDAPANALQNYFFMNLFDLRSAHFCGTMIPVKSAFAGMAIYKVASLKGVSYTGIRPCEHIALHEQMSNKGKGSFYINPNLILLSGHQGPRNVFKFLADFFSPKTS